MHTKMLYNPNIAVYRARLHNKNPQNGGPGQVHATTEAPARNTPYDVDDAVPKIEHRAEALRLSEVDLEYCVNLYCLPGSNRSRAVLDPASLP